MLIKPETKYITITVQGSNYDMAPPWKAGDVLFVRKWDEINADEYRNNGVNEGITNHPAVLLHRPSPNSAHVVVAIVRTKRVYSGHLD